MTSFFTSLNSFKPTNFGLRGFFLKRRALPLAVALSLATLQAVSAHEYKLGDLTIGHPWSRATPEGAKVAVGYLSVKNGSSSPDRLVSVTAEIAGRAEIHDMAVKDGVMTMRPVPDGIEIPAVGEVKIEPGSYHIMFLDLKRPPMEGEKFKGTLTFAVAGTVAVQFAVDKMGGDMDHGDHDASMN